jgi:hypothetical protein
MIDDAADAVAFRYTAFDKSLAIPVRVMNAERSRPSISRSCLQHMLSLWFKATLNTTGRVMIIYLM